MDKIILTKDTAHNDQQIAVLKEHLQTEHPDMDVSYELKGGIAVVRIGFSKILESTPSNDLLKIVVPLDTETDVEIFRSVIEEKNSDDFNPHDDEDKSKWDEEERPSNSEDDEDLGEIDPDGDEDGEHDDDFGDEDLDEDDE